MIYFLIYLVVALLIPLAGIFSDKVNNLLSENIEMSTGFLPGILFWPIFVLCLTVIYTSILIIERPKAEAYSKKFYNWYLSKRK